jgi:hypothetical protein
MDVYNVFCMFYICEYARKHACRRILLRECMRETLWKIARSLYSGLAQSGRPAVCECMRELDYDKCAYNIFQVSYVDDLDDKDLMESDEEDWKKHEDESSESESSSSDEEFMSKRKVKAKAAREQREDAEAAKSGVPSTARSVQGVNPQQQQQQQQQQQHIHAASVQYMSGVSSNMMGSGASAPSAAAPMNSTTLKNAVMSSNMSSLTNMASMSAPNSSANQSWSANAGVFAGGQQVAFGAQYGGQSHQQNAQMAMQYPGPYYVNGVPYMISGNVPVNSNMTSKGGQ